MTALLSVRDLRVWLDTARGPLSIVDGVSFDIASGQVFGLAGESGSGKTITALALLGLLPAGARTDGAVVPKGAQGGQLAGEPGAAGAEVLDQGEDVVPAASVQA